MSLPSRLVLVVALLVAGVLSVVGSADIRESNNKAVQMVDRSWEGYGGQATDALQLSMRVVGEVVHETQSWTALAPFERYPLRAGIKINQAAGRQAVTFETEIAGDFRFPSRFVSVEGKAFSMDPVLKTYEETPNGHFLFDILFPHRRIDQAKQNRTSLRYVATDAFSYATAGQVFTLQLDPTTHLVLRLQQIVSMGINGDGYREYEFHNYTSVRGVKIPQRISIRNQNAVHGLIENVYNVQDLSPDAHFDAQELELPSGFKKADYAYRGSFKVNELSKDIYLLENVTETTGQWSYNVFFVVFDEFVLVAEAPVSSSVSEKVLSKIHEIAPGKKVRYLVQSHHHGDHIGGIRPYIADQVTILAGPGMISFIEKIAAAPFLLNPDRLAGRPQKPVVEAVVGPKIVEDRNHRAVVYNVGPSPHARDMLIVHLPKEKILYQSDLINDGEYPANKATEHFLKKLQDLDLQANRIAGLHGKIVSGPISKQSN